MKIFLSILAAAILDEGVQHKNQAIEYFKDQNLEGAIKEYLAALKDTKQIGGGEMRTGEEIPYQDALRIYLNARNSPQESGLVIKNRYTDDMREHGNYYHLGYLVALAYANLGQFDRFFNLFYASYQRLPEHFLAYKTKAILHTKLYELAKTSDEKEKQRVLILENVQKAKAAYPQDFSLYKMEIVFSENNAQDDILIKNVKELMKGNLAIPRTELPYYFDELFAHGQIELAQELTKKAREWYPYSRTIDAAEEFINQKQSLKE